MCGKEIFSRAELLLGERGIDILHSRRVAVFGIGGVGSYVMEGLARSGIGALDLIDCDTVSETDINRQIIALHSTIGLPKTQIAAARVLDINPSCNVVTHDVFFGPETEDQFDFSKYDYVVDAIDTVSGKLALIQATKKAGIPIISCMGTGNKLDPIAFEVSDIYKTSGCPLAKVMRKKCRELGIDSLKVVFSNEEPLNAVAETENGRHSPGSVSFVPSVAGMIIVGEVVKDLIANTKPETLYNETARE
ncbi:MAG: tRNA threonylcarbamoyladenosine dehydratase [Lachnospiraceae bacterium]|jgi:tRNA A37 threonylcarbamoyladenosine dehydratase